MTPPDFWPKLALACFICVGVWKLFDPKMLLGKLGDFLNALLPKWATKPLYDCPPCMSSFWGAVVWLGTGSPWQWTPAFILSLCGLNTLVTIEFLNRDVR